ncbi:uncharacterized protein LOC101734827 isoform X2 [Xenopus tropicalis]|uniref:Uncharacterized protein LOC101734827 isoform X2 n=1 Tax=Xenopus tropicalis TaxID=8364 RepID=A0A8J1IVA4_XENTR|nr:uncharacterized protein LOC101734827 isoform X2 [Xenopus tropicalis]
MEATRKLETLLGRTLMNLPSSSLKSFINKLIGYKEITMHDLGGAGPEEVVKQIIRYYTTKRGPKLVIQILEEINENQAALELKTELKTISTVTATKKKTPVTASAATKKKTPGSQKKPPTAKEKKTTVKTSTATKEKTPGEQQEASTATKKKTPVEASTKKKMSVKASTATKEKTPGEQQEA